MATVLEDVGKKTIEQLDYVGSLNIQLWSTPRAMKSALPVVGNRYRWQTTVRQMLQTSELRHFGALNYVNDLVTVGFMRELGPLLTAIAVSGRSGSAFAADIGTMKGDRGAPGWRSASATVDFQRRRHLKDRRTCSAAEAHFDHRSVSRCR